jgi:tRNA threonylcarbamoyladenosine biosynthesis protein TsaE
MITIDTFSTSEEETIRFGARLGAALRSRAVVGLTGPLGAGKTRLVQGIARGAGYAGRVRSPTFALLQIYRGPIPLRHFDFYRIESLDDGTAGEWEDLMAEEGLSLIEWADRFAEILPEGSIAIDVLPVDEHARRIRVRWDPLFSVIGDWRMT